MVIIRRLYVIAGPIYYAHNLGFGPLHPDELRKRLDTLRDVSSPLSLTIASISLVVSFQSGRKLMVTGRFPEDPELIAYLTDESIPYNKAFELALEPLQQAMLRVMDVVRYLFDEFALEEYGAHKRDTEIFLDNDWKPCVKRENLGWVPKSWVRILDPGAMRNIQKQLNENVVPLYGMRFLTKAKSEDNQRDKCLLLAIAAELSIKEFFHRVNFDVSRKIPFQQLYTTYLEKAVGVRSPYADVINENSLQRNAIIHDPATRILMSREKAIAVLDGVEKGILHLMMLLYPDNVLLARRLRAVNNNRSSKSKGSRPGK